MSQRSTEAWLCLGGNIGQVRANMVVALERLDGHRDISLRAVSGLYRTPPWGKTDQPAFLNACAAIDTTLQPEELLAACLEAEQFLDRRREQKWGPRTIDLDIIAMDGVEMNRPGLTIPHPRVTERAFVLVPLGELAPELMLNGNTVSHWIEQADRTGIDRIAEASSWFPVSGK